MPLRLDAPRSLRLATREVPLELSRHPRARRITLRLNRTGDGVSLVLPRRTPVQEALEFAERNAGWILKHLEKVPARVPFTPGAVIPFLGEDHVIAHDAPARLGVSRAGREIRARARAKAAQVERRIGRLSLRDTRSRWGSCNSDGNLSFSWRLILAPE